MRSETEPSSQSSMTIHARPACAKHASRSTTWVERAARIKDISFITSPLESVAPPGIALTATGRDAAAPRGDEPGRSTPRYTAPYEPLPRIVPSSRSIAR
eukprot:6526177-Prymnesium_polylepis.1